MYKTWHKGIIFENLSGFLWIGNTQKITHKRLIEHEQKLDECLLKEKTRGKKRMVMVSNKISLDRKGTR